MPISLREISGGGAGSLIELAPEPGRISTEVALSLAPVTTEQLALSLSGKFAVSAIGWQTQLTFAGSIVIRVVVDGVEILSGSSLASGSGNTLRIYGNVTSHAGTLSGPDETPFLCRESLQVYVKLPEAKASTLRYVARPIK